MTSAGRGTGESGRRRERLTALRRGREEKATVTRARAESLARRILKCATLEPQTFQQLLDRADPAGEGHIDSWRHAVADLRVAGLLVNTVPPRGPTPGQYSLTVLGEMQLDEWWAE